ncbi:MAG TPA: NfeD family protein [Burkholderiales bacterium]|nr:NfeD family protein [Burkholderiales bacterium]
MTEDVLWAIVGLALVIVELLTGTFYLLMLGIAAFGAAIAAWLGQPFGVQAVVAAVVAAGGCWAVHVYHAKNMRQQMPPIDAGQRASFETWLDQGSRLARVRYRGATWEALIEGDGSEGAAPGSLLYVIRTDGNTLKVAVQRPA